MWSLSTSRARIDEMQMQHWAHFGCFVCICKLNHNHFVFFSRKSLFLFLACKCGNDDSLSATSLEKNEIKIWRKRTIHLGRMSSICYRENLQVSPLTSEWEKEKNEWHVPNSNVYWIRSRCLIQVTVSWKIWRIVDFRAEISSSNWFVDSFFFFLFLSSLHPLSTDDYGNFFSFSVHSYTSGQQHSILYTHENTIKRWKFDNQWVLWQPQKNSSNFTASSRCPQR